MVIGHFTFNWSKINCIAFFFLIIGTSSFELSHPQNALENGGRNETIDYNPTCRFERCNNTTNDWLNKMSLFYSDWSVWSKCQKKENGIKVRIRERNCKVVEICQNMSFKEEKTCKRQNNSKKNDSWKQMTVKYKNNKEFVVMLNSSKRFIKRLGVNLIQSTKSASGKGQRKRIYSKWSRWTICSRTCVTQRYRWCKKVEVCGNEVIRQTAYCYTEGSDCETWMQSKIPPQEWNADGDNLSNNNVKEEAVKQPAINNELPSNSRGVQVALEANNEQVSTCGIPVTNETNSNPSYLSNMLRIIGGRPSQNGKWPWIVAVLNRFKEAICGGTLVSRRWVLTAAHCVKRRLYVTIGEFNLASHEGKEVTVRVRRSIIHPEYNSETVDNDLALLKLPSQASLHSYTRVACLPRPKQHLPTKQLCTIIGWGKRSIGDAFGSDILHEAQVPIVSSQTCKIVYEEYQIITPNMFCAGYRRGKMDTCSGDSGGPLLCKDSSGRWTIFGITSFGEGCGKKGKYGIYTRLPNYVKWIQSVIQD